MDEQRLGEFFRDGVGEIPSASFSLHDVVAASRRATARRRNALAGGTMLGVAVLAGSLLTSGLVGTNLPGQAPATVPTEPEIGDREADLGTLFDASPPAGAPVPRADAAEGARASCGPVAHDLVADLAALLTDYGAAISGPAGEVTQAAIAGPCPEGSRAAAVPVAGGTLYVLMIPQVDQVGSGEIARSDGGRGYIVPLNDGRGLAVISVPQVPGQPPPLADHVPELAARLAYGS